MDDVLKKIKELGSKEYQISVEEVRELIKLVSNYSRNLFLNAGFNEEKVRAVLTKLRDAGRRSPPWRPTSGRIPGRPQDGADGNRRLR